MAEGEAFEPSVHPLSRKAQLCVGCAGLLLKVFSATAPWPGSHTKPVRLGMSSNGQIPVDSVAESAHDSMPVHASKLVSVTVRLAGDVKSLMTGRTEGDQIRFVIGALLTAQAFVVNVQILEGPTSLASPTVPLHHLSAQLPIVLGS